MDDKAQISVEYMIIIALLVAIAALVALLAGNFFGIKSQTQATNKAMAENLKGMWKV